jgi:hypothetical protein
MVWWLITAILAGATLVEFVRAPRHGFYMLGLVALMITITNGMARLKGVAAWPTRAAHDALADDHDEAYEALPADDGVAPPPAGAKVKERESC